MTGGLVNIRTAALLLAGCLGILPAAAREMRVQVHNACIPVMTDRPFNVVAEICVENRDAEPVVFDGVSVALGDGPAAGAVRSLRLVYTGTMSALWSRTTSWAMKDQFKRLGGCQTIYCDPGYALPQPEVRPVAGGSVWLPAGVRLPKGRHYFYVSAAVGPVAADALSDAFGLAVTRVGIGGSDAAFTQDRNLPRRLGVAVRRHGDDGVYAYRIPGLVTTNEGTLLGVYDVRRRTSLDLQDDIDVGLSRSTDGGRTWEPMRIIMDMGTWGGLPEAQNGIGDPAILVDERTGEIFVVAVWVHGIGNDRAWTGVGQGMVPEETSQLMIVSSRDDGRTWSAPRNITPQVKDPSWSLTLQGPGRGITMRDGTLVFPIQYIDSTRVPNAGVMYSPDHGRTWRTHRFAKSNTTESQVAEPAPGVLMLNMRDNRRTGRAVFTTRDLGRTWTEHASSGALREPVCMASLLHVPAERNVLGRDVLLFSNPDTTKGRNHVTVKASLDGGYTWLPGNQLLLDEEENWGYSCLTMVDPGTVGILYEGSTAQLVFQTVKLRDIVRSADDGLSWRSLPETAPAEAGYAAGVSAMYAGAAGDALIAAGGANFPDVPAAEGGEKTFYDGVFLLRGGVWNRAGRLPAPAAYGVTFPVGDGLVLAGGANASGALRSVVKLRPKGKKVVVAELPALPCAVEQAAGAAVGGKLYLAGGIADGTPSAALYMLDTRAAKPQWRALAPVPEAFVQPVMAASAGRLYLWGGFDPRDGSVSGNGYCYDPAADAWHEIPGVPDGGTFVGGCAATLADGRILCTGGVDRAVFAAALRLPSAELGSYLSQPPAAYRFRAAAWIFDPASGQWSRAGVSGRTARAGASLVPCAGGVCLLGGEIKPGVRTPDVCRTDGLE